MNSLNEEVARIMRVTYNFPSVFVAFYHILFVLIAFIWFILIILWFISRILVKESNEKSPQNEKIVESVEKAVKSETEFVSDTFQTNDKDLEEVKEGMKKLGIDTLATEANQDVKKDEEKTGKIEWKTNHLLINKKYNFDIFEKRLKNEVLSNRKVTRNTFTS